MTAQYTIIYNDIYTITFEWWNDQYNILNSFIRTMSVYVYDNNGELILEDRNIVLLYYNIEHHNDLSKIKIHIDISINDYSVFSLFVYNFIKNTIKAKGFSDLYNCLLYYDRDIKIKELFK